MVIKSFNHYSLNYNLKIQEEIAKLKQIDTRVKTHEEAHKAVGGRFAGSEHYKYVIGPDGKKYAVAGDVQITIKKGKNPKETIENMEIVKAAALAPVHPSSQDLKVAAVAQSIENKAKIKLIHEKGKNLNIKG